MELHQLNTARKLSLVKGVLAFFAVWPLVHHVLVLTYDVNPWHLAGFSMYCKPRAPIGVMILDSRGVEIATNRLAPEMDQRITAYAERRRVLGDFAAPDGLAREVFDSTPWLKSIRIDVVTYDFSASAARFEKKEHHYPYAR